MPRWAWIVGGVALVALLGGGAVIYSRSKIAALLRDAFRRYGLPPAWGEALGRVESGLRAGAVNLSGPDGARGGAWGPTQITEKTARAHGYTGPIADLTTDPALAAEWTARIAAAGRPATLDDLGAWWNAGRRTAAQLPPGHVTLTTYLPRLRAAASEAEA